MDFSTFEKFDTTMREKRMFSNDTDIDTNYN